MPPDLSQQSVPVGEVFISYSWETEDHVQAVLALSNRLRSEGIDCVLDQYEQSPPEGWQRWMDRKIRDSRLVLMICTETYYKRVMGDEGPDRGLGVRWEGGLIYQHIYNSGANTKFIPVLFRDGDRKFIPTPVQSATYYRVDTQAEYDKLYARLLGVPAVEKPKLGPIRSLPKKDVKTNISMYVSGPIDVELWNAARWSGTFMMMYESGPPVLGLAFLNEQAARRIFEQWHARYGDNDAFEELRVSIIEGDIKGEEPGYSVHIGTDFDNLIKRYKHAGLDVNPSADMFMSIERIHRMNPSPGSQNLRIFKEAYRLHKNYLLVPGVLNPNTTDPTIAAVKPMIEWGIFKNAIHFRDVDEIGPGDPDIVVLNSGEVKRPLSAYGTHLKKGRKKRR